MKVDTTPYLRLRRDIHRHPELSNQERETTRRIREFLAGYGLELRPIGGLNGGFVRIDAGKARTLCFRADIDALPLNEQTGAPFASEHPGVMHACGHDMHTAIAAGVACELHKARDRLGCNVAVLFQPAEEANPTGGARPVAEAGFLKEQGIDEMYGLHMWPSLPVGDIELRPGPIMAASDRFQIEVLGAAAHAAEPHLGVDAIAIASELHCALTQKLRREVDPFTPISVSIGAFQSFGRYNVVCGRVLLEGTVRTTDEATRAYLHRRIQEISRQTAALYRGRAEAVIHKGYGIVQNSPELFRRFAGYAQSLLGAGHVHTDIGPSLIGEDFYYFSQTLPSLYFHMGCQSEHPLHSNRFLPREEVLDAAVDLMTGFFLAQ
ncbi:MAG: amidohydrolase [Lawsonibacter sp.]|nr:amidohydrolase [Lawsonibacter sp.]